MTWKHIHQICKRKRFQTVHISINEKKIYIIHNTEKTGTTFRRPRRKVNYLNTTNEYKWANYNDTYRFDAFNGPRRKMSKVKAKEGKCYG